MNSRLYVGNLSYEVSVEALRQRFAECGVVSNVHLATDRASGRMLGYATVTMADPAAARVAIAKLNGAMFEARPLRVNEAGEERDGSRSRTPPQPERVKITSQFRERQNMAYELDCAGVGLVVRVFPIQTEVEAWRIEVVAKDLAGAGGTAVTAEAPTRALALDALARSWVEQCPSDALRRLDWPAIRDALATVRAV
jgi:RNA recognition motif-containing protein